MILVEGNLDVITLHQAGFDNTVATMGTALTEEHVRILSRYTKELVLCYDNDGAGEDATQRALALLKGSGLSVKVLRLPNLVGEDGSPGKQDADDFIRRHGGAAFEALMNRSENSVEYRLNQVEGKYDLHRDEHRAHYLREAAAVVASLSSPVEREVYAGRAAHLAGVSREAVLQEVEQLRKKQAWEAQKKQERRDLTPARNVQPRERELHYQNTRSARAEEGIVRIVLLDGEFFRQLDDLSESDFSSPLLGKVYGLLRRQWEEGRPVSLARLEGVLSGEEMAHLSGIAQQPQPYHTAQAAIEDLKRIIHTEARRNDAFRGEDLSGLRETLRQRKGYGG
jgi:DNA primase